MEAMPIDVVIGQNVAGLRIGRGTKHRPEYSQTRVARDLRNLTGEKWDQGELSRAEHGKRRFTVADLLVLGFVFQVSPIRLMHSGREVSIWLGGIGIPEGDLLHHWILGPRKPPKFDLDQLLAPDFHPDQLEYPPFNPDDLETTWPEPDPQRTWAIDRLTNAMDQGKEAANGDD